MVVRTQCGSVLPNNTVPWIDVLLSAQSSGSPSFLLQTEHHSLLVVGFHVHLGRSSPLHYTALPEWASTLGMLFSLMLWMPSWGGMINGLFTLRGAWHKVSTDPVLKFFVVGLTFYGNGNIRRTDAEHQEH